MKKSILWLVIINMAALFLSGCSRSPEASVKPLFKPSLDKDVTTSPEYHFSSFVGTVWKTRTNTAIAEVPRYTGALDTKLLAPPHFDSTRADYNPPTNVKIIAVLPPGTQLHITRLLHDQGAWGGVQVEATIDDGANAQKAVLLDPFLLAGNAWSRGPTSNTNWTADPDTLQKVETH